MLGRSIIPTQAKLEAIIPKGINIAPNHLRHNKAPSGHQPQEAEGGEALEEDSTCNQKGCSTYSVEKIRGIQPEHARLQFRSKKIVEAEARQNQPKQVLHTASCYSPYIPKYVGNQQPFTQPTTSVASTS
jgi:hypothetical protein